MGGRGASGLGKRRGRDSLIQKINFWVMNALGVGFLLLTTLGRFEVIDYKWGMFTLLALVLYIFIFAQVLYNIFDGR